MGFFKKVKKAVKKVGKTVEKVAKPVVKNIVPIAATAVGTYLGGPMGGAAGNWLSGALGGGSLASGLGKAVGGAITQGTEQMFTDFGNNLVGNDPNNPYSGYANMTGGVRGVTPDYSMQYPNGQLNNDMYGGVNFTRGFETPIKTASQQGQDTRDYLAAAYPEMNPWERAGTGGTGVGADMSGQIIDQENTNKQLASQMALQKAQMSKDLLLAKLQSDTALKQTDMNNQAALMSAGLASQTSRLNTRDQVNIGQQGMDIQKQRLAYDIDNIVANTEMSRQNKEESIGRVLKNAAETQNIKLTAGQIEALTKQALAGAALSGAQSGYVSEQTRSERMRQPGILQTNENLRYGTGNITREAQSVGNMVSDAFSGTRDWIAGAWNDMWSKSDGVSSPMSR